MTSSTLEDVRATLESPPSTGRQARARLLLAGGTLFALGNLVHPLEHSEAAEQSATWVSSHLAFGVGAVLIAAGMPALTSLLERSRAGLVGVALTWLGMLSVLPGAWFEAVVAPLVDARTTAAVEAAAPALTAVQMLSYVVGPVVLGVVLWRRRAVPLPVAGAMVVASLLVLLSPALPGADGLWIIAGTVALGTAFAGAGTVLSRPARQA